MASWILVPCLVSLRNEFNQLAPGRDKASDGSIGDLAHQQGVSDHSPDDTPGLQTPSTDADATPEVHAIDIDCSGPWPAGVTFDGLVARIVLRHRSQADSRLQNCIWDRKIYSRSWGWTARAYNGSNPHDHHAHFSARYGSGSGPTNPENDTSPWGLKELTAVSQADVIAALKSPEGKAAIWAAVNPDKIQRYDIKGVAIPADPAKPHDETVTPATAIALVLRDITMLKVGTAASIRSLSGALNTLAGKDFTDEQAIISGVLAGMDYREIAAAIPPEIAQQVVDQLAARLQA